MKKGNVHDLGPFPKWSGRSAAGVREKRLAALHCCLHIVRAHMYR